MTKFWNKFFHIESKPMSETRSPGFRLPRRLGDRVLLGVLSTPILLASSLAIYGLFTENSPHSLWIRLVCEEVIGVVFALSVLTMLWVIATPRFIERALQSAALHVSLVVFIASLGLFAYMIYAWLVF